MPHLRFRHLFSLLACLTAFAVVAQSVPMPKPKPGAQPPATTATAAPAAAPAADTAATPAASQVFTHEDIIAELKFEQQLATARGENTAALQRLIDRHQQALDGVPPTEPFLGGAWIDPSTGASFSIYQQADRVTVITETLGHLDELWQRLDGTHDGKKVTFLLDDKEVPVTVEQEGSQLRWDAENVWKRIPNLEGVWADPDKNLVFTMAQVGTDLVITMASEEGKKYWTQLMGTQRGDRLVIETKDGFISTTIAPTGDVIFWADDAKTKWVKLPPATTAKAE